MVTSACERDIRSRLDEHGMTVSGDVAILVPAGVLRGLLRDLDMWRNIGSRELELVELEVARRVVSAQNDDAPKLGFTALVLIAKHILDEVYPEEIFPSGTRITWDEKGERVVTPIGETGPQLVAGLRRLIALIEERPKQ